MFQPTNSFSEIKKLGVTQINNDRGYFILDNRKVKKVIEPEIIVTEVSYVESNITNEFPYIYKEFLTNIKNITKKIILFGVAEEIAKYIDEELKFKMSQDVYLSRVLVRSLIEVKKYLTKSGKSHELNAFVWYDVEDPSWEENILSVRIECKDNREKREIWDDIDEIVRKHENEEVIVLTQVDRYEL